MFSIDAHLWSTIFTDAVALSVLDRWYSLLTSLVADSKTRTRHDSERELIGQGIGNMASSIFGGIPGAGATMRTVVNIQAGGRTRISGIESMGFSSSWCSWVQANLLRRSRSQCWQGLCFGRSGDHGYAGGEAVALCSACRCGGSGTRARLYGLLLRIQAVALGLALASLLFMKRMGDESSDRSEVGTMDELMREPKDPEERELHNMFKGKVHVHKLHGPLDFGFTSTLQDMAASIPDTPHVLNPHARSALHGPKRLEYRNGDHPRLK